MTQFERSAQFRVTGRPEAFEIRLRRLQEGGGSGGGQIDPGELGIIGDRVEQLTHSATADYTLVVAEPWLLQAPQLTIDVERFLAAVKVRHDLFHGGRESVIDPAVFGISSGTEY